MTTKIIYTCDRCKAEQTENTQFWEVALVTQHHPPYPNMRFQDRKLKSDWCRNCLVEVGILPKEQKAPDPPPPLTLEEIIRELIKEEVSNQVSA